MPENRFSAYQAGAQIAELYDHVEDHADDLALIRTLIDQRRHLRIVEPFCGTGRILLPLAEDGHTVMGLDRAKHMLARARAKLDMLPAQAQTRVTLHALDVIDHPWPKGFDLVILGGNCLYELATPQEQALCIERAAEALDPGGLLYVDNDHMEGALDLAWRRPGVGPSFPTGTCSDGTRVKATTETIWYDAPERLVRFRRAIVITRPDGTTLTREFIQQKHPVSQREVADWLDAYGFAVDACYGDRSGNRYKDSAPKAIFWAHKA